MRYQFVETFDKDFDKRFHIILLDFFSFKTFQLCINCCFNFFCVFKLKIVLINK